MTEPLRRVLRKGDGTPFDVDELVAFAQDGAAVRELAQDNLSYFSGRPAGRQRPPSSPVFPIPTKPNTQTMLFTDPFGSDNPFLVFKGEPNEQTIIGGENPTDKQFGITIVNASTTLSLRTALFGGYLSKIGLCPGLVTDGAFTDVSGTAGLSATATGSVTIKQLLEDILRNPTMLRQIRLSTNQSAQVSQAMEIKTIDTFKSAVSRYKNPDDNVTSADQNDKLVYFNVNEVVHDQKQIYYTLLPLASVTIKLYFGHSFNVAKGSEFFFKQGQARLAFEGQASVRAAAQVAGAQREYRALIG